MNRKGNLPEVVLMISAVVLTVLGLVIFASFSGGFQAKSQEYSSMIEKASFNHNYIIERAKYVARETIDCNRGEICNIVDLKKRYANITSSKDLGLEGQGNFYGKIRAEDFEFTSEGNEYTLKVNKVFISAESGSERTKNSITRNFDICMKFDEKGIFKGNC